MRPKEFWLIALFLVLWLLPKEHALAQEKRIALLVGNQRGWKGESRLKYVLSGDVQPLAKRLRSLGFLVKTVENGSASKIRSAFRSLRDFLERQQRYKTILFYYSGHADPTYFHTGPRGKNPISYREFTRFFNRLSPIRKIAIFDSCYSGEIIRRFGSLSRYKKLLKRGNLKGIKARSRLDLKRLMTPKQGHEQGLRLIASSLDASWELHQRRASVFTYHLLRGLKGKADLDHNGRITVDELFDYTSQQVLRETGQRPQQLVLLKRSSPYAIAPVYRSRLNIGSQIAGKLEVKVANFVWFQQKQKGQAIRLAVVDGKGTVFLKRKNKCFVQNITLPKGGEATVSKRWKDTPCRQVAMRRKGALRLRASIVPQVRRLPRSLALSAQYTGSPLFLMEDVNWGGSIVFRPHRWWGIGLSLRSGQPRERSFQLSTISLRAEFGWTFHLMWGPFAFDIFAGTAIHLGFTIQHSPKPLTSSPNHATLTGGLDGIADLSWWLHKHVGIRVGVSAGVHYFPVRNYTPIAFQWQFNTAILLGF